MERNRALGRLEEVSLREAWSDEARDFTPWLLANADRLGEALNMDLNLKQAEYAVGDFSLDLIGEDIATGQRVIIENQLERSDHRHLGQLLTYAGGTEPAIIIWLAQTFREEHIAAFTWLNSLTGTDIGFFAVEIDVFQIGDSALAPHFTVVARPNEWERTLRQRSNAEVAPRKLLYQEFWQQLIDAVAERHPDWLNARKAPLQNWIVFPTTIKGVHYAVEFASDGLQVGLSLNSRDRELNAARYAALEANKDAIDMALGNASHWIGPRSAWAGFNVFREEPAAIENREEWPALLDYIIHQQERLRTFMSNSGLIKNLQTSPTS